MASCSFVGFGLALTALSQRYLRLGESA